MADIPEQSDEIGSDPGDENSRGKSDDGRSRDPKKVIERARRRFKLCEEAEDDQRKLAREDFEFRAGKQWPDQVVTERANDKRPCLTINRMPQFIHQVTNDQRQNRPSIKVHPEDNDADIETGKILQGGIRHIEQTSNADVAYDTAVDSSATGGFGFFRVLTAYADPMSFNQDILIKALLNPFAAYLDPSHQEPDGSDANYGFIWEDLQTDEYKSLYPDSKLATSSEWESISSETDGWVQGNTARVVEYFEKDFKDDKLLLLSDGTTVLKSEYEEPAEDNETEADGDGEPAQSPPGVPSLQPPKPTVVDSRPTKVPFVYWYKINGIEILEETEWPCEWIPLIPVYGSRYVVDGKVVKEGVIRHAKDAQRMYNFWVSAETETIALAPRAPFIGAEGQFEGHEPQWKTANTRNHPYLEYKVKSINGVPSPPPQRQPFEPPVQGMINAKMAAAEDMKATTGIYDASLGNQSAETSGIAIQRRNNQAQTSNFHIIDNLTRSIKHAGRIVVALIPKVYNTKRVMPVIDDEGNRKLVTLNAEFIENGKPVIYDTTRGRYGVSIDVGPSFATKRQEAMAFMQEMVRAAPQLMQVAGDLIVKNSDAPGAQELSDRIKKTLPPGLVDDDKNQQAPLPPQVKAQIQQMGQMLDQLTKEVHEQAQLIETKKMELESRERIEMAKLQANIAIEDAKLGSKEAQALLDAKLTEMQHRLDFLGMTLPLGAQESQSSDPDGGGGVFAQHPTGQSPTGGAMPGNQSMEQP